jgi:hypothetical protein
VTLREQRDNTDAPSGPGIPKSESSNHFLNKSSRVRLKEKLEILPTTNWFVGFAHMTCEAFSLNQTKTKAGLNMPALMATWILPEYINPFVACSI